MLIQPPLKFSNATVLCIGDVMLDHFIYGRVERISPESPVPILNQQHQFSMLGGAGNVVRNILSLGGKAVFISVVGKDKAGQEINNQLKILSRLNFKLFNENNRITIQKSRFIAQGQQLLRVDEEVISNCTPETEQEALQAIEEFLPFCQAVIISDYHKGLLTPNLTQKIIHTVKNQHPTVPIIIDPKGRCYKSYENATILTPNLKEISEVLGHSLSSEKSLFEAGQNLIKTLNLHSILITQGSKGMTLINANDEMEFFPAKSLQVYDVSGAGDTVVATLGLGLASHYTLKESCYLANEAAGIVVSKVGTAAVSKNELENSLKAQHGIEHSQRIVNLTQAIDLVKKWRFQNQKIGFTNGCFDLLHLGHLHILQESSHLCDKLIVGLNSDSSIKSLKGKNRPVQSQETRANILAALKMVDAVIVFNEETPYHLIKTLQPDVLIKGADYTVDQVIGADLIQSRGGQVILVDRQEDHSTTKVISRIKLITT